MPVTQLDSLASGRFDRTAFDTLLSVERSRRLLLLRAFHRYASSREADCGPLQPVDDAWNLLLRVEETNRAVVEELLADPHTGSWVGHALRRLRLVTADQAPLWFHIGQLHCLAAAATIRADTPGRMTVPVWDANLVLPSLGYFRLPVEEAWTHAELIIDAVVEVRCAGTVTKLDPASGQWFQEKRIRLKASDEELSITLDDVMPYRGPDNPSKPTPLTHDETRRWRALLEEAWQLLVRDHYPQARELAAGLTSITPIPKAFRFRPRSVSVEDGFGAAILSEPFDAAQLAVTLVHEFQHSVLNGIRHVAELVTGDDPAIGYAPWRDDPRPLGGIIHGVFAFTAIAEFWAIHREHVDGIDADLANFELALWRHETAKVLGTIENHHALTAVGSRFLARIGERVERLRGLAVPARIAALANTAAVDHDASWRACHQTPDPHQLAALTDAWATGGAAPPVQALRQPTVQPTRPAERLDVRAALIRVKLSDTTLFDQVRDTPQLVAGASQADIAFVAGELDKAYRLYLTELSKSAPRASAWSGLGLTMAALGNTGPADVILARPDVFRAVSTEAASVGAAAPPDKLVAWLSRTGATEGATTA